MKNEKINLDKEVVVPIAPVVKEVLNKADLDEYLKGLAESSRLKIDGDFITFDKKAKLSVPLFPGYPLKNFLTANPVSFTKLSKNLLLKFNLIRLDYQSPIEIRASYHSPEYDLLNFGAIDSKLYTEGCALALGVPEGEVSRLYEIASSHFTSGEVLAYPWGVHIGYSKSQLMCADKREAESTLKTKVFNLISNDKMKNILVIGAAAAAAWFFFFKKK